MDSHGDDPVEALPLGSPADSPLALQMAARVDKLDPPRVDDVFAAAALSVIRLLDDERSAPDGEWGDAVAAWNGARIRKIMRRGRASAWVRAQDVPGVTVKIGTAEVRAFVPGPMAEAPRALAKLQIQTPPLDELVRADRLGDPDGSLVVVTTPDVDMSWGKLAAQCAHGGQRAWERADPQRLAGWEAAGAPIRVVHATHRLWEELRSGGRGGERVVEIRDGGFTEIPTGTLTVQALWR